MRRAKNNRIVASKKDFEEKMQGTGAASSMAILKLMKSKYKTKICKSYRLTGIPHKEGCCRNGPCCDWEELMENELADTIFKDLPDSMRPGNSKGRMRGGRGGLHEKENQKKKMEKESDRCWESESEEGELNE